MDRVAIPLGLMGAVVHGQGESLTAPLIVEIDGQAARRELSRARRQRAGEVGDSFGRPRCGTPTTVREDVRTRATTEDMLRAAGVAVDERGRWRGRVVTLPPGRPRRHDWFVPGDPSQAAFFAVLGAVAP